MTVIGVIVALIVAVAAAAAAISPFSKTICRRLAAKYSIAGAASLMRQPGTM